MLFQTVSVVGCRFRSSFAEGRIGEMLPLDVGDPALEEAAISPYRPNTDWTSDSNGARLGTANRLAGKVDDEE